MFLWVKSFLPPTGILDVAAATVAVTITLSMLLGVNSILAHGHELCERELLQQESTGLRSRAKDTLDGSQVSNWASKEFWSRFLRELLT